MIGKPEMKSNAGIYEFNFPELKVKAIVDRLSNGHGSPSASVTIQHKEPGAEELLDRARINLESIVSRNQFAKALAERAEEVDWTSVIKYIAVLTLDDYRRGEPIIGLGDEPESMELVYQLYPLLPKGEPTTIFGPGGTAKSYLADYIAVLVKYNYTGIYGWLPTAGNVLFLDWEAGADEHRRRIWAIKQGLGITDEDKVSYRFCTQALADDIVEIQRCVLEVGAGLVIVDSQVAASGGDELDKAEAANRYYNALRSLRCTTLTIDHVPKNTEAGKPMPYGSVFKWNRARNIFEVKKYQEPGEDSLDLGLYHRKINEGKLINAMGARLHFSYGAGDVLEKVTFSEADIKSSPELSQGLSTREQMRIYLLSEGPQETKAVAEAIGKLENEVRARFTDESGKKMFVKLGTKWGVKAYEE